jgi:phage-related protein
MAYTIELYEKKNDRCPTRDFLDSLSASYELPYVDRMIGLLEMHGHNLRRPHADILRDHIYELRIRTRRQIRLLFFFFDGDKIVITHGFIKKSNSVPQAEIDRAVEYRKDYLLRFSGAKR